MLNGLLGVGRGPRDWVGEAITYVLISDAGLEIVVENLEVADRFKDKARSDQLFITTVFDSLRTARSVETPSVLGRGLSILRALAGGLGSIAQKDAPSQTSIVGASLQGSTNKRSLAQTAGGGGRRNAPRNELLGETTEYFKDAVGGIAALANTTQSVLGSVSSGGRDILGIFQETGVDPESVGLQGVLSSVEHVTKQASDAGGRISQTKSLFDLTGRAQDFAKTLIGSQIGSNVPVATEFLGAGAELASFLNRGLLGLSGRFITQAAAAGAELATGFGLAGPLGALVLGGAAFFAATELKSEAISAVGGLVGDAATLGAGIAGGFALGGPAGGIIGGLVGAGVLGRMAQTGLEAAEERSKPNDFSIF